MREKLLYGVVLVLAVALAGVSGYLVAVVPRVWSIEAASELSRSGSASLAGLGEQGGVTQLRTIVVSGLGEAVGKPNQAVLRLGAATTVSNASGAVAENAEIVNKVIDALKVYVAEKDVETASFSVYPKYSSYGETIIGFEAAHMLTVTTTDLEGVGHLIDVAIGAGANRVEGVYFTFTKDRLAEMNALARQGAVGDARARAEKIADSLGVKIVGVAGAVEETYQYPYYDVGYNVKLITAAPTPIMPPAEAEVTVTIRVTYIID